MNLDATDKQLLRYLQQDSKQTNKELSNKLGLSVTAVYERIKKLERQGIVSNYVALVDKSKVEKNFVAFCQIKLIQHTKDYISKFEREILKLDEVMECYHVSGDSDYIIKIVVSDMETYRQFMVTKLTAISHIGSTHSNFVISEVKHSTCITL